MEMEEGSPSSASCFGRLLYTSGINCSKDTGGEIGDHFPITLRILPFPISGIFFVEKTGVNFPSSLVFG
jgi:hypothetical protein